MVFTLNPKKNKRKPERYLLGLTDEDEQLARPEALQSSSAVQCVERVYDRKQQ